MAIRFACPVCKTEYTVNDREAGEKSECKVCGQRLEVPKPPQRLKTILGEVIVDESPAPGPTPPPLWANRQPPESDAPEAKPRPQRDSSYRREEYRWEERAPRYNNEDSVRFGSSASRADLERMIEDVVGRLGHVMFVGRGEFEVVGNRFRSFATDVRMAGQLYRGRREDEWTLSISFSVQPSAVCWVIAILGFLFILIGPLILIIPFTAKGNIQNAVSRTLREVRHEAEAMGDRSR